VKLKPSIASFLILLTILCLCANIHAQSVFPRIEPDSKALDYYRLSQRSAYSWTELAEISLWASGDVSLSVLEKIKTIASELNSLIVPSASQRERAEFILNYMHKNILKSYSLYQTRLDTLLSNGRYNCVSSAVLYTILCKSAGINTSGVMTKDHAFVIAHIDGQDFDVETTNPYGFDPGNRREFHDSSGKITGFAYVPPQNYRDRQTINQVELVSLILNNRIGDYERANNYTDSVPVAVDRAALLLGSSLAVTEILPSDFLFADPRNDLMDRLLNYGAFLLRGNKEEDVIRWAAFASSKYPNSNRWQELFLAAVNNKTSRFIRERKISDARIFLENNKEFILEANYSQLDTLILDAEFLNRANNFNTAAEGDEIISAVEQAQARGRMGEKRAAELITYIVQKTALSLCSTPAKDWRAAIRYLENALLKYGSNREFEQSLQTYRNNLAADYHNRFAAEWNKRNFTEAENILNEGLVEFPNNRQLLADKQTIARQAR
jgi:transglutaminase-like putative cysteine protease